MVSLSVTPPRTSMRRDWKLDALFMNNLVGSPACWPAALWLTRSARRELVPSDSSLHSDRTNCPRSYTMAGMATSRPFRVAVIGSGPAGFYATTQLLASTDPEFEVDLFDRLPTPFGLVRAGVAPDHPKIKAVTKAFDKTAEHERFRFAGGVELGADVSREDLRSHYHAVVYAVGTATDRQMGVAGEDLRGSHAATEFVAWYNGHPDYSGLEFDLLNARRVAVVGNGNVAIDVARMIALAEGELAGTDTADHAIEVLTAARVEEVVILGRRGPAQAAFTNPELREMGELERADVIVDAADLELDAESQAWLGSGAAHRTNRINVEILREYAAREPEG